MSQQPQWEIFFGNSFVPDVRWQGPEGSFLSFRPDQYGRVDGAFGQRCHPSRNFFPCLRDEVLPAARAAVPPVKGRYSYPGSELRNRYLEAIVRELNARKLFPLRP
jgi:hypothetical protein